MKKRKTKEKQKKKNKKQKNKHEKIGRIIITIIIIITTIIALTIIKHDKEAKKCFEPGNNKVIDDQPIAYDLIITKKNNETYMSPIILTEEKELCYYIKKGNKTIKKGILKTNGEYEKTIMNHRMIFKATNLNTSIKGEVTIYLSRPGKRTSTKKQIIT